MGTRKGVEASGKREEMLKAAFALSLQEEAAVARRGVLKAMGKDELKELLTSKDLEPSSKKEENVEMLVKYEVKLQEDLQAHALKVDEVAAKKQQELEAKSSDKIKDLCVSKGLKVGSGKEDRIERLVEQAEKEGEFDKIIAKAARAARREELCTMEKPVLLKHCERLGIDPLVKEVLVDRLISYEEQGSLEPATKKARTS